MQRSGASPSQNAAPSSSSTSFFSSATGFFGGSSASSRSRPGTSSGVDKAGGAYPETAAVQATTGTSAASQAQAKERNVLHKDRERRPSLGRKASFSSPSRKRSNSTSAGTASAGGVAGAAGGRPGLSIVITDNTAPPALPDFALAAAAKLSREAEAVPSPASFDSYSKMLSRSTPTPVNGYSANALAVPTQQSEASILHQHIQETANKRISTLDYLRKAHEGRVYWFNTLLFDKPDLARMPYFDSRKLARRATNYLLLGLSLPTVIDLNSGSPTEFLRSLNTLLNEFDAFQQLHSENGSSSSSLSRARLPQMFRRGTQGGKVRRTSGATGELGYALEPVDSNGGSSEGAMSSVAPGSSTATVITFAASDNDLLPGEEYTHLLTPSLPFEPDFFETFATLCDVLIDCYTRLLGLVPTPRECNGVVAELFTKADAKVRKIIVQGVVKEFEDTSRGGVKTEVANVGKIVLGGLM